MSEKIFEALAHQVAYIQVSASLDRGFCVYAGSVCSQPFRPDYQIRYAQLDELAEAEELAAVLVKKAPFVRKIPGSSVYVDYSLIDRIQLLEFSAIGEYSSSDAVVIDLGIENDIRTIHLPFKAGEGRAAFERILEDCDLFADSQEVPIVYKLGRLGSNIAFQYSRYCTASVAKSIVNSNQFSLKVEARPYMDAYSKYGDPSEKNNCLYGPPLSEDAAKNELSAYYKELEKAKDLQRKYAPNLLSKWDFSFSKYFKFI